MWGALGDTFAVAMALALSPIALTTALVLLLGERGRRRALLFAGGWYLCVFVVTAVAMWVTDTADEEDPAATADGIDILHLVFAVVFFVLALVTWIKRPSARASAKGADGLPPGTQLLETEVLGEDEPGKPGLFERVDHLGSAACFALGFAQGILIIKNIPLAISAGMRFGAAELPQAEALVLVAIFAGLASLGTLIPLVAYVVGGERVDHSLRDARRWIEAHMTAITLVILVVVGGVFLGEGLGLAD
ncbi:hypothetical protein GCM10022231_12130 [Gordonia caeni]|uniref:GAP family protein n=2 Tax=Gordonia caeni TaxID=1007097 RepID=A0ABP7NWA3_9ACTN